MAKQVTTLPVVFTGMKLQTDDGEIKTNVVEITSASGKVTGHRAYLGGGSHAASQWRKAGKAQGLSGDKLTAYVQAGLKGNGGARVIECRARMEEMLAAGLIPDVAEARKNTACIKFVRAPELKSPKAKAEAAIAKMPLADLQAIFEILSEKLANAPQTGVELNV